MTRPPRMARLGVALALAGVLPLAAQQRPPLDGRRLPIQADTFGVYIIHGADTVQSGTLVDRLRVEGRLLTRIYTQRDRILGPQDDSIVSDLADLHPVAIQSLSGMEFIRLDYTAGHVTGWARLPNGDSVGVDAPLPDPVYDGSSYDLVVRAADLADGFELSIPALLEGSNTVTTINGRVTGSAAVDGHDCWVFQAHFANMPVTFWVDKQNRALRRQLLQPSVGFAILFAAPPPIHAGTRAS